MKEYKFFLRREDAFGPARSVWLLNDGTALAIGERLLMMTGGVDICRNDQRVALLIAP